MRQEGPHGFPSAPGIALIQATGAPVTGHLHITRGAISVEDHPSWKNVNTLLQVCRTSSDPSPRMAKGCLLRTGDVFKVKIEIIICLPKSSLVRHSSNPSLLSSYPPPPKEKNKESLSINSAKGRGTADLFWNSDLSGPQRSFVSFLCLGRFPGHSL